jgi:hypothetical protein
MTTTTKPKAFTTAQILSIINKRWYSPDRIRNGVVVSKGRDMRPRTAATLAKGWLTDGIMLLRVSQETQQKILSKLPEPGLALPIDGILRSRQQLEDWDVKIYDTDRTMICVGDEAVRVHDVYANVHESPIFFVSSKHLLYIQRNCPAVKAGRASLHTDNDVLQWNDENGEPVAVLMGIKKG